MAPPLRARFLPSRVFIAVPKARQFSLLPGADGNLHVLLADTVEVSLSSLATAMNQLRNALAEDYIWMYFYPQEPQRFEPTVSPHEPFNFEFFGDRLRVRAECSSASEASSSYVGMQRILAPLLHRRGARLARIEHQDEFGRTRSFVNFDYNSLRGLRVRDARRLADEVSALTAVVGERGALDAVAIKQLVIAGRADLLVGQREHQTFDAKSTTYETSNERGRFELARDVAAFANSASGGVIVCGLWTRKVKGSDTVHNVTPVDLDTVRVHDWIRTVRRLVVPAPEGLSVEAHPRGSSSGYVFVDIPSQPEYIKPFLVRVGQGREGGLVQTEITVPVRIGEHTEYSDPATLHGLLTAGRVALSIEHDERRTEPPAPK